MKTWQIALIVCGALLLLIIMFLVFARMLNKKNNKKLQNNLKKIQQEKEDFENSVKISLNDSSKEKHEENKQPVVEDYLSSEEFEDNQEEENNAESFLEEIELNESFSNSLFNEKEERENILRKKRDEDFQEFMNEHAYSRKILDQNLIAKIKNLPPEMKAIILNSVFDKFDDNK